MHRPHGRCIFINWGDFKLEDDPFDKEPNHCQLTDLLKIDFGHSLHHFVHSSSPSTYFFKGGTGLATL